MKFIKNIINWIRIRRYQEDLSKSSLEVQELCSDLLTWIALGADTDSSLIAVEDTYKILPNGKEYCTTLYSRPSKMSLKRKSYKGIRATYSDYTSFSIYTNQDTFNPEGDTLELSKPERNALKYVYQMWVNNRNEYEKV